jgi:hypothetical protein
LIVIQIAPVADGRVGVPAALVGDPAGVHPVVQGDHGAHAGGDDVRDDIVVVRQLRLVHHALARLDPRPLHAEPEHLDA